jgi:hypothetical protein
MYVYTYSYDRYQSSDRIFFPAPIPLIFPPTRLLRVPNCIARFALQAVSFNPRYSAASRNNRLSPPTSILGSSFTHTGKFDRYDTKVRSRYGYRASLACDDRMRSSLERLRVGSRVISSCSYADNQHFQQYRRRNQPHLI